MSIIVIKSLLAVLLALGLFASARRGRASLRHLILAALFVFLLLLPLVQSFAPQQLAPRIGIDVKICFRPSHRFGQNRGFGGTCI